MTALAPLPPRTPPGPSGAHVPPRHHSGSARPLPELGEMHLHFNVTRAIALLGAEWQRPAHLLDVASWGPRLIAGGIEDHHGVIDKVHALGELTDVRRPVIIGAVTPGMEFLLDGRHRIWRALHDGVQAVPFVALSPPETLSLIATSAELEQVAAHYHRARA